MPVSEVQRLRKNIANEYMAAQWGLSGLAYGTPQHAFVTARMERMGGEHQQLADLVGASQAARIFSETLETLPEHPERNAVLMDNMNDRWWDIILTAQIQSMEQSLLNEVRQYV